MYQENGIGNEAGSFDEALYEMPTQYDYYNFFFPSFSEQQLVGTPVGYNVTLECFIESFPISLNYWSVPKKTATNEMKYI